MSSSPLTAVEFWFFRHGQSEMNLSPQLICGQSNESKLTPRGEAEAAELGSRLKREGVSFDAIYASPAARAETTARIAMGVADGDADGDGDVEGIAIGSEARLLEICMGEMEGVDRGGVYTPAVLAEINADPGNFKFAGGESQTEVEARMVDWVEAQVEARPDGGRVAAFGHGLAIKCLLRHVMDWKTEMTRRTRLDNTSITRLTWFPDGGYWNLICVNDAGHLANLPDQD